jgi:hypothetical protein
MEEREDGEYVKEDGGEEEKENYDDDVDDNDG